MSLTRRSLIRRLLLAIGIPSIVTWRRPERQVVEAAPPASRETVVVDGLSGPELANLVAFGEIVVAGGSLSPAERAFLVDHIAYRMARGPGPYRALCRTTVGLLDRLAGGGFSSLDAAQRHALVSRHRLASPSVMPDEDLGPAPDDARVVRTRMVPDLIGGYYASPAGWAVVGYDAFPGRCSDLARYTGPGPSSP